MLAHTSCRQGDGLSLNFDVAGWVAECKEAMPWAHSWKSRRLSRLYSTKEGFHGPVETIVHFSQQFAIHLVQLRIMLRALLQRAFCFSEVPLLTVTQLHDVPVVQAATLALHEFQGCSVLRAYFNPDLFAEQHSLPPLSADDQALER
jgi:hypothetical protein